MLSLVFATKAYLYVPGKALPWAWTPLLTHSLLVGRRQRLIRCRCHSFVFRSPRCGFLAGLPHAVIPEDVWLFLLLLLLCACLYVLAFVLRVALKFTPVQGAKWGRQS